MDQSIEEYKTLRTEILRNFEAMEKNLIACITTNGVALAYGIQESQPLVLILASLIPMYFWIQHTNYRNAIAKLASYISVFLEGKETNLMWESRVKKVDLKNHGSRIPYFMRTLLLPYPVLLIISIIISVWKMKPANASLWLVLLVLSAASLVVWFIAKRADVPYRKLRKPWIEAFREIEAQEQPQSESVKVAQLPSKESLEILENSALNSFNGSGDGVDLMRKT